MVRICNSKILKIAHGDGRPMVRRVEEVPNADAHGAIRRHPAEAASPTLAGPCRPRPDIRPARGTETGNGGRTWD